MKEMDSAESSLPSADIHAYRRLLSASLMVCACVSLVRAYYVASAALPARQQQYNMMQTFSLEDRISRLLHKFNHGYKCCLD